MLRNISSIESTRKAILSLLFIFLYLVSGTTTKAAQHALPSPNEVITLINQYRQQNGIPALAYDGLLAELAQAQSNYQAQISTITHTGPGGTTPQERAAAAGYGDGSWFYLSEIIYGGTNATPSSALSWWMNSSLHNSIMLDSKYTEIGAGVATDGSMIYFTAVLGGPSGGSGSVPVSPTQPPGATGENPVPTDPSTVVYPVARSTPGPDGSVRHIVLQGQTLWTIAAIYETTTQSIIDLNQLASTYIFPGDDLLISPASESNLAQTTAATTQSNPAETTTPAPASNMEPRLGTPFSLVLAQPTDTPQKSSQPGSTPPAPAESSSEAAFIDRPTVNVLLIAAVVIAVLVILVSGFTQNKPDRPNRDDPAS